MSKTSIFSPEVRTRAVRMVVEYRGDSASEWAAIRSIASKIGCTAETLRKWLRQAERDRGEREGVAPSGQERLKALGRENRELKRANEILRLASVFFALTELDRWTYSPGGSSVGGWVSRSMKAGLVLDALEQAQWARSGADGVIHHSDAGSQYLSIRYTERWPKRGLCPRWAAWATRIITP